VTQEQVFQTMRYITKYFGELVQHLNKVNIFEILTKRSSSLLLMHLRNKLSFYRVLLLESVHCPSNKIILTTYCYNHTLLNTYTYTIQNNFQLSVVTHPRCYIDTRN